ncbi:MAG TPA: hypothetical protein PKZ02_00275 [Candidatus Paceibacterota bacterium]|nr:hypothetical protein [Candidatus Paceibacterota bacterium]
MRGWRSRQVRVDKSRRRRRRSVLIFLIILAAAFGIFYVIFLSGWLAVKKVEITGAHFAKAAQLEEEVNQYLSSQRILGFINFRNNLIFLFAKDFSDLVSKNPVIKDFSLHKDFKNKSLVFNLHERQSKGILCLANEEQNCFYFDEQGVVFVASPQTEGNVIFLIQDNSGRLYSLGDKILTHGSFDDLIFIWNSLAERFHLNSVQITTTGLIIQTSAGWQVYLNQEDLTRTKAALFYLLQSDFDFESLEYLDLRYLRNIYWKTAS